MTEYSISAIGYGICALSFIFLTIILVINWRGHIQSTLLISACVFTVIWSLLNVYQSESSTNIVLLVNIVEFSRNALWIGFLFYLLKIREADSSKSRILYSLRWFYIVLLPSAVILLLKTENLANHFYLFILIALIGLVLVEQVFRNTPMDQRWSIKFFCVGVGGILAYDFYMYSEALIFHELGSGLLNARGFINAMLGPLIAISASRNPAWALRVHVSKQFVFHSAAILGAGFYLLAMGVGAYYIQGYGGEWGSIFQIVFLVGALVLMLLLLFSGHLRAKAKVILSKNFFRYKYDYRDEWLKLTNTMAMEQNDYQIRTKAIMVIAEIVNSPAGVLCLKDDDGIFRPSVNWNIGDIAIEEPSDSSLIHFLKNKKWVINVEEFNEVAELYKDLDLPRWVGLMPDSWLILPFLHRNELIGFAVLTRSQVLAKINWEDRDLLLTAARQIASYLALLKTNADLMDARQFDAFNKLSAYVVHDLKNLVAQLSLVVANASRHKDNPEFMQDAIETVKNATEKMQRLLSGLKKNRAEMGNADVNMVDLVREVVGRRQNHRPIPEVECSERKLAVSCDRDRMQSVLEHLVENAQQATPSDGWVKISLLREDNANIVIQIADNGCGMEESFVRSRLFKPFQTTKGNAGMGIGVYEAREYFLSLKGNMSVVSELNQGTIFTVVLPESV